MALHVFLNEVLVGTLEVQRGDQSLFQFDKSYLNHPYRPVLGRYFEEHLSPSFQYTENRSQVPPFFQNCLPEAEGAMRALIARQANTKPHQEMAVLQFLGEDLPGALIVRGAPDPFQDKTQPIEVPADQALASQVRRLRFSLAGIQLKFSVLGKDTKFTLPVSGMGGNWIVKLPDQKFEGVPHNEFSTMSWARDAGILVPNFKLVPIADIEGLPEELVFRESDAFAIQRYDRGENNKRIHQEDFAQILNVPPDEKYEHGNYTTIANIVRRICGEEDYEQFLRRLVFMVVSGNADAHLKNWSFIYPDGRRPRLSPAYDLVCTNAYLGTSRHLALRLSKEDDFYRIRPWHFQLLAEKIGASKQRAQEIVEETVTRARESFQRNKKHWPLKKDAVQAIETHLKKIHFL